MLSTALSSFIKPVSKSERLGTTFFRVPSSAKTDFHPDPPILDNDISTFSEVQPPVPPKHYTFGPPREWQHETGQKKKRTNSLSDDTRLQSQKKKCCLPKKEGNKGEKAEVRIKKILKSEIFKSETEKESSTFLQTLFKIGPTDTVHFPTQSMEKASNKEKADCFIEVEREQTKIYKISIKYQGSNDCSIVNQDHRAKNAYLPIGRNGEEGLLFNCLGGLDSLISRLNYERAIGERPQDIDFTDIDFTAVEREAMEEVLVHHSFIGAGAGAFQIGVQANSTLTVHKVNDPKSWFFTHCPTPEDKKKYVQSNWNQYIFAIRKKGMQVESSYEKSQKLQALVAPWVLPRWVHRAEKKGYNYPGAGREYVANFYNTPKFTLNIRMKK